MLRKHEPIDESIMNEKSEINTICETLRQIYHLTEDAEIKLLCRTATSMAKAMSRRLRHYKDSASYADTRFWDRKD